MALLDRFEKFLDQVIPPPDEVAHAVRRGEALLAAGDSMGALRIADVALATAPGFLRATVLKVDALAALGAPYDGLAVLDVASRDRALPADVLARMVELAARVGDEWRALELEAHTRARLRGSDRAVARRLVEGARTLLARGATAAGLRLARGATLADPDYGAAWLLLGRDALARGDRTLARRALERGTQALDPADGEMNRIAGEVALGLGDETLAARCLRRAWIVGEEAAVAPLVAVLARTEDPTVLERVLADAVGELGEVARALVALSRGEAGAAERLEAVRGDRVPEALWSYALEVTLRAAPSVAARWAREAGERPGGGAVRALEEGRTELAAGRHGAAQAALERALGEPVTREAARELLREAYARSWGGRPTALLEGLAARVRETPEGEALEAALKARRRELDEPLRVVLLGEFSAGKSTFLNALVGAEVSPMGVLPTTAQVHWLRQGDPGARVVDLRGGVVETLVEDAPRVVARKRAAGEVVDYVEVTLPLPRLGRIEVVDTPGFNAGDPAHEEAVRRAFELADVALWLFDARQAGKHSELGPLAEARARGLPVVGVLNKIDRLSEGEVREVLGVVREGFGALAPCVGLVSARQAFEAVRTLGGQGLGEAERAEAERALEASGWPALVRYLEDQLIAQRIAWKQARVAARSRALVDEALESQARAKARAAQRAEAYDALEGAIDALRDAVVATGKAVRKEVDAVLRDQLRGLRDARVKDVDALVADAVAEIGYRARARALADLGARVAEVERLGVAVGLVGEECAALLTAPVVSYLDHAVAEGVRDAASPAGSVAGALSFVASDPLTALSSAVDRRERVTERSSDALDLALAAAREELASIHPPAIVLPGAG